MKDLFKSIFSFWGILIMILCVRWVAFEPFVIPSGSMIPSLLIHDHILVKKYAYGVRIPFTQKWIKQTKLPERGDIIVFKKPGEGYFMIKRVVGLPGDTIKMDEAGRLTVNGEDWERRDFAYSEILKPNDYYDVDTKDLETNPEGVLFYEQKTGKNNYLTMFNKNSFREPFEALVPQDHLFVMGDNRDNSSDSRYWGPVDKKYLIGEASHIWLSCQETVLSRICLPNTLRLNRFFHKIK